MYARKVSLCLRSESAGQFLRQAEDELIPLLRKQRGFLDQLIILSDSGDIVYLYTFWENSEDAERYDRMTLPALSQLLTAVVNGALHVHAFAGSRGCLSSGSG
jgi:hypothetical protein